MQSWSSWIGVAAFALLTGAASAQETLRVGTEGAYPPYNAVDASGQLVGFDVDVANELCRRIEMRCEIMQQEWDGMIPALLTRRYDAIMAGMAITAEREKRIAFSRPYSALVSWFVSAKDGPLKDAKTLDEIRAALKGKAVGVQRSTVDEAFLEAKVPGIQIRLYDTQDDLNLDLENGRVDAGLGESQGWAAFLTSDTGRGFGHFGPDLDNRVDPVFGPGVGIGLRQEDTALKAKLDKALGDMTADGSLARLSTQWFGFDHTVK